MLSNNYLGLENEGMVSKSTIETEILQRRTVFGSLCQFPMEHEGEIYNDCFWGIDGNEFCKVDGFIYVCESLWPDHDHEREQAEKEQEEIKNVPKPSENQVIERYTVKGQKCELPKFYNGRYLTDCLYISATRELCYANMKWQYCKPLVAPSPAPTQAEIAAKRRFTVSGKMCTLPFYHLGKEYDDCVELSGGKKWCKLDNTWQECKAVQQVENSVQTIQAETYAPGFDVVQSQMEAQKEQEGSNGAIVGVSVVLVILIVTAIGLGVAMYMMRRSISNLKTQRPSQFQMS
eukprot:TRINITY_DN11137_c0_g1_i3.p1 TRINITY_DN11137_c0_g1~~TRINITY_DN11137_c0_g1_i3.p1  ORF type:complete len:328 (+),score=34.88 TRINITY_DN11137_c0_g1_i3:115-984(+)